MVKYKILNKTSNNRIKIIYIFIIFITIILCARIIYLGVIKHDYYNEILENSKNIYYGEEMMRGNIYDRNMKLIVGSRAVRTLVYKGNNSEYDKAMLASNISAYLEMEIGLEKEGIIKNYILALKKNELEKELSDEIKLKYNNREIDEEEYKNELKKLISEEEIDNISYKNVYIYYLLNNGYSFSEKVIKERLTDEEYAYFSENEDKLNGIYVTFKYERYYPYGDVLKEILGSVSTYGLPSENVDEYLNKGYILIDNVGISNLEKEYESYLRGVREKYYFNQFGEKVIVEEGRNGYDLVLSIDIELQQEVENIIVSELKNAKKERNTEYLNKSYVIISNPSDGSILASAGRKIIYNKSTKKYSSFDNSSGIVLDAVTPGSIVKGASHLVGYSTGNLKIGYTVTDSCIKVASTPMKCSWTRLGVINDVTALKYSSNYYQFLIAIKVGKGNYVYNNPLTLNKKAFTIYRNMYNSFGLGVKTGIDLPYENIGFVGNDENTGSILDFSIGQYDTYTPASLMQYINTLSSSGKRYSLNYVDKILDKESVVYEHEKELLNKVKVDTKYFKRVKMGLREVLKIGGTGYYYVDPKYNASGKTGTSESFLDTDYDGLIDTETITHTFGAFTKNFSMIVVTPDVATTKDSYISNVNKRISYKVSNLYFEKYT